MRSNTPDGRQSTPRCECSPREATRISRVARGERADGAGVELLAEQVAPDGRRVEHRDPEVEEVARRRRAAGAPRAAPPRASAMVTRGVGERALGGQRVPVARREGHAVDAAVAAHEPAAERQRAGGAQDGVADHPGRDRRPRDHVGQIRAHPEGGHLLAGRGRPRRSRSRRRRCPRSEMPRVSTGSLCRTSRRRRSAPSGVTPTRMSMRPAGIADRVRELPGRADVADGALARRPPASPAARPRSARRSAARRRGRCGRRAQHRARTRRRPPAPARAQDSGRTESPARGDAASGVPLPAANVARRD